MWDYTQATKKHKNAPYALLCEILHKIMVSQQKTFRRNHITLSKVHSDKWIIWQNHLKKS